MRRVRSCLRRRDIRTTRDRGRLRKRTQGRRSKLHYRSGSRGAAREPAQLLTVTHRDDTFMRGIGGMGGR